MKLFLLINNVAASTSLMTKQDSVVLGFKQNERLLLPQIHCHLTKDNIYERSDHKKILTFTYTYTQNTTEEIFGR